MEELTQPPQGVITITLRHTRALTTTQTIQLFKKLDGGQNNKIARPVDALQIALGSKLFSTFPYPDDYNQFVWVQDGAVVVGTSYYNPNPLHRPNIILVHTAKEFFEGFSRLNLRGLDSEVFKAFALKADDDDDYYRRVSSMDLKWNSYSDTYTLGGY